MTVRSKRLLRNLSSIQTIEDVKQYLLRLEDALFYADTATTTNTSSITDILETISTLGGGGSGTTVNTFDVSVNFGGGASSVTTTVTGLTWVTASSVILCFPSGDTADHGFTEVALEELHWSVGNLVVGTGFDLFVYSPTAATTGTFSFKGIGI